MINRVLHTRVAVALLAALLPSLAHAQISEERVRMAIDDGMAGLGQALAGGSIPLGAAGATGKLGGFRLGGSLNLSWMDIADPTASSGTINFILPTGAFNARVGLVGRHGIFGGLDAIGRAGPLLAVADLQETRWFKSFGGRVGVVSESTVRPAVSVTAVRTWVSDLQWNEPRGDETSFNADIEGWSMRADVGKTFGLLTPYVGGGVDKTEVSADYRIPAEDSPTDEEIEGEVAVSGTHRKAYVGAELDLRIVTLIGEVGRYESGTFAGAWFRLFH